MFITAENFDTLPYNLSDLSDLTDQFTRFVASEEKWALRTILGSVLYQEFIEGLFTNGNPAQPIAEGVILQKWKDLRDGANYNLFGKDYRYNGIKELLIPYVYSMWTRYTIYYHSSLGIVMPQSENGTMSDPGQQVSLAYNSFSKLVGDDYSTEDNLFGFLTANKAVYTTWVFTPPGLMNAFGI